MNLLTSREQQNHEANPNSGEQSSPRGVKSAWICTELLKQLSFGITPPRHHQHLLPAFHPSEPPNIPQGLENERHGEGRTDRRTSLNTSSRRSHAEAPRGWGNREAMEATQGRDTARGREQSHAAGLALGALRGAGRCCCAAFSSRCHRPWAAPAAGWTWPPSS